MRQDAHRPDGNSNGDRRKRRIGRRRADARGADAASERAALQAELVLLREENARLKSAEHRGPDIGALLTRARSLPIARPDRESVDDETTRVLVEGLVIRETLLEICQDIERAMVAFEAKLRALEAAAPGPPTSPPSRNGHGPPDT